MLSKVLRPLKLLNQEGGDIKKSSVDMAGSLDSMAVGLRILTENSNSKKDVNVVISSGLKFSKPIFHTKQTQHSKSLDHCFLKSCFLCHKTLSLDKEVYMYRGDQGFCSVECRNRQIYLDEMREREVSTKKTLASIRRCRDSNWRETSNLLKEYRQRQRPAMSCQKDRAIFI